MGFNQVRAAVLTVGMVVAAAQPAVAANVKVTGLTFQNGDVDRGVLDVGENQVALDLPDPAQDLEDPLTGRAREGRNGLR